jgi:hypothetical protein
LADIRVFDEVFLERSGFDGRDVEQAAPRRSHNEGTSIGCSAEQPTTNLSENYGVARGPRGRLAHHMIAEYRIRVRSQARVRSRGE